MRISWGDRNERNVMPTATSALPEGELDGGQKEWLAARWQFEDERWERQALQNTFTDALDRAGNMASPVLRLYGIDRLEEMAQRRMPGGSILWNADGFPFFLLGGRCLSALLVIEEHPEVRAALLRSLQTLISFARQGEQGLLYLLLPQLADANRAVFRTFRETLGRYLAKYGAEETALPPLAGLISFCSSPEVTLHCLNAIAQTPESQLAREQHGALRAAQARFGEPAAAPNNQMLEGLSQLAARLCDTRDLLAAALREFQAPPLGADSVKHEFEQWRSNRRLFLLGTFLAGARLAGAQLPGAILVNAHLEGANLEGANLVAAELKGARLAGAELHNALLHNENLPTAEMRDADWWNASPSSWRGNSGETLRLLLQNRYPEPAPALRLEVGTGEGREAAGGEAKTAVAGRGGKPASIPPMENNTGSRSAADKIADLKRKAADRAEADQRADPRHLENPMPAVARESGRGMLDFAAGRVAVREKALPKDTDVLSERDLMEVTDLMGGEGGRAAVASRESGLPKDDSLTEDDLIQVTDLMKG